MGSSLVARPSHPLGGVWTFPVNGWPAPVSTGRTHGRVLRMTPSADDAEAIRQLLTRYNVAIDFGDAEAWAGCFTPDGTFECIGVPEDSPMGGRHEGRDGLLAYAQRHFA